MTLVDATPKILVDCSADVRQRWVRRWLIERRDAAPTRPLALVMGSLAAAGDLLHPILLEPDEAGRMRAGVFMVHRFTLDLLADELCRLELARRQLAQVGSTARRALVGRVLHETADQLRYFAPVAQTPGFARTLSRTLDALRLHGVAAQALRESDDPQAVELALLLQRYEATLSDEAVVDRAARLALASEVAAAGGWRGGGMAFVDLQLRYPREVQLLQALGTQALGTQALGSPALGSPALDLAATVTVGDGATREALAAAWPGAATVLGMKRAESAAPALGRTRLASLQARLFDESVSESAAAEDETVTTFSAPTAPLECAEIARRTIALLGAGVAAERIAVLVRQAFPYVELLDEAFRRAGLKIYPAQGAFRPDPAGRAFLLLLRCKHEGLTATRFAEYLSLGQVPSEEGAVSAPTPDGEVEEDDDELFDEPQDPPQQDYVAPARWERLIGDASVIGGIDRWRRRLDGLQQELGARREALDDADSAHGRAIERDLKDLAQLGRFALPLLSRLDALPDEARWGDWIEALSPLAQEALRRPARVLEILQELWPLAQAGPVSLQRVMEALQRQLTDLRRRPPSQRYGRVYVGLAHEVGGRSFEVVFVAGLAERSFPQKVLQDPVLPDAARDRLSRREGALTPGMATAPARRQHERLALHLASGAARKRLVLSYPRMELAQGQPRVPSFYLLEAIRAARGTLPDFEQLIAEAAQNGVTWLERPYPAEPEQALDAPEYDLSLLAEAERKRREDPQQKLVGYSGQLHEHPRLVHALRAYWQRRQVKLTVQDGLLVRDDVTLDQLEGQRPRSRPFAPTTLERYARCPYQFYLYGLLRLRPLQDLEPEGHQQVDPLTRGRLYHEVQFNVFRQLRSEGVLPLRHEGLSRGLAVLRATFATVSETFRETLAPAVPVLWQQEMRTLLAELSSWLRREAASEGESYTPLHFELGFGLPRERTGDEASSPDAARVGPYLLRGAIDLVEAAADGSLRVTDYKTGRSPATAPDGLRGGSSLQRVLYGLAYEAIHPAAAVREGRLYYCSERGGYREQSVTLDEGIRARAMLVLDTIDEAIRVGRLPAVPERDCQGCDYLRICGRDAAQRARRKANDGQLEPLRQVRRL